MIKEYIKKEFLTPSKCLAEASTAIGLWIDLKAGSATVMLEVNKDFQARQDGGTVMDTKNVVISAIDAQAIYSTVHDAVVAAILADAQYIGGTLEQVEVADPIPEVI